jgi:hypothetical protein
MLLATVIASFPLATAIVAVTSSNPLSIFPKPTSNSSPYKAPLYCPPSPSDIIPDSYLIMLFPGRTLQDHFSIIGVDMKPYFHSSFGEQVFGRVLYSVYSVNEEVLERIRSDIGVQRVECDGVFSLV